MFIKQTNKFLKFIIMIFLKIEQIKYSIDSN